MELKYNLTLGLEYFLAKGWVIEGKIKITGVSFVNNKIRYLYGNHNSNSVLESELFLTLEEAKVYCLQNITNDTNEIKKEIEEIKEEDLKSIN